MSPDIKAGAQCPDFQLLNQEGEEVRFSEALKGAKFTALIFYRGHW
jgi:peroxiredoxin